MRVLVVDDDKTTRKMLSLILKSKGYDVVTAENGMDGLQKLGLEQINLILTDMNMPYMDGIEFTKQVRANPDFSHIPIVMLTTEADEEEKQRAYKAGVDDYLVKPATAEQIVDSMKKIIKKIFGKRE
ncbi:Chemotaxis regulator - transmits chemoreceptor signals to flagelllar motor components CheY [Thermodesulfovibrio sp. N1]|jgi:two-component system chemotaxis response regulator CheY|uniref:response regulator n=1 Tax=Thermodesulfovibrio sp. N1 TaxID=1871110 RepID=UPI00083B364D|nr:response regulator [Thermodesulfovibrio sp. N1]ODA44192.1 Chemotaxis regulator - transmits chemoreceptor signals to flagelllar motor components CheY [Thermodesulfovibrio sp. N1]